MKLDAETLRKLALQGAKADLRDLEAKVERARDIVRQLSGASVPAITTAEKMKPKAARQPNWQNGPKAVKHRRKRRSHTEKFKAIVVKEAREADNASAIGKKHKISPSLVRLWMEKAK